MVKRKLDDKLECPIEVTLDIIGSKWKGMILYQLINGTCRFNELRRLMPKVTQRILTLQLRELENDGVIQRIVYPEVPPKVEYRLSAFGETLKPVLALMEHWGEQYRQIAAGKEDKV